MTWTAPTAGPTSGEPAASVPRGRRNDRSPALDLSTPPLPAEARAMLRNLAADVRTPPLGLAGDPIALRRWVDALARRLDRIATLRAVDTTAAGARARATLEERHRPARIVVELRGRARRG